MIQRIQTLWLLIAIICAGLTLKFAFYSGVKTGNDNLEEFQNLTATSNIYILTLTIILIIGCVFIISLYNKRKKQLRFTILAAAISVINLVLYFGQIKSFNSGNVSLAAVFAFAIPIFILLASRGIWKDEKLIKSLDRLR
jgi:drug/metabolite transporter (DMT)-like permease